MNTKFGEMTLRDGVHLPMASVPLQIIAALSALVFVCNFTFEVLVTYETSFAHLVIFLCLNFVLSTWALIECLRILGTHQWNTLRPLAVMLTVQIAFTILRLIALSLTTQHTTPEWFVGIPSKGNWHYLFLLPASFIFMGIHRAIITLFTLNEKNLAANTEKQMLDTLNALAIARDNETGNHIIRTQNYVKILAKQLRKMGLYKNELNDQDIEMLFKAAPLHDIGKVGIPDSILRKPGRLTDEEWEIMKTHPILGETILLSTNTEPKIERGVLQYGMHIAGGHHEKWDGSGYPRGLKGKQIPLAARIMAVADVYDALVSERIYKSGWNHSDAVNEIVSRNKTHFDPDIIDAFISEQTKFQEIAEKYRDK